MWFEKLTGFPEVSPEQVRENLALEGNTLKSRVNGKKYLCGILEMPTLGELRARLGKMDIPPGKISVFEVVGDAMAMHADEQNAGSLFQVASQFNLLEMASPDATPEMGVGIYEYDRTQGPVCAMAAGAGTIYRNYLVGIGDSRGQTRTNQIDCLAAVGKALGNDNNRLWKMRNGYALASGSGLKEINRQLESLTESELDELRIQLSIGLQWNTEVTISDTKHTVSQAYCSALPVAYSRHPSKHWARFGGLVLEASYEATICAGILNSMENGHNKVFLTLLGGGVFGNDMQWIISAIKRALVMYENFGIEVGIVSYGRSNRDVYNLCSEF